LNLAAHLRGLNPEGIILLLIRLKTDNFINCFDWFH